MPNDPNTIDEQAKNKRRLESHQDVLTWWLDGFTALVVLGLIIEYLPDLVKAFHPPHLVGGLLITVGVAGELVIGVLSSRTETKVREINDSIIANIRADAAAAEERAAEANRIAEEERLARVRIEQRLGGWTLDAAAQDRLIEQLKPFPNTPFALSVNQSEMRFMEVLYRILASAGWSWKEAHARSARPGMRAVVHLMNNKARVNAVDGGVTLWMSDDRLQQWGDAAKALAEGLMNEGDIPVEWNVCPREKLPDPEAILVEIGRRNE
jgi:hypothetical protein